MYMILKQTNYTENLWSFYTESGILWNTDDVATAEAKLRTLLDLNPVAVLRLIQDVEFSVTVELPKTEQPTEPKPEQPTEPEPGTDTETEPEP